MPKHCVNYVYVAILKVTFQPLEKEVFSTTEKGSMDVESLFYF